MSERNWMGRTRRPTPHENVEIRRLKAKNKLRPTFWVTHHGKLKKVERNSSTQKKIDTGEYIPIKRSEIRQSK